MDPTLGNPELNAPETTILMLSRALDHSELSTKDQHMYTDPQGRTLKRINEQDLSKEAK